MPKKRKKQKEHEKFVGFDANAGIHPVAMMIKLRYAVIAAPAMLRSQWFRDQTGGTNIRKLFTALQPFDYPIEVVGRVGLDDTGIRIGCIEINDATDKITNIKQKSFIRIIVPVPVRDVGEINEDVEPVAKDEGSHPEFVWSFVGREIVSHTHHEYRKYQSKTK